MVLEEVSSDPDPYFSSSSSDGGDGATTSPTPLVNISNHPQPFPLARIWGFSTEKLQRGIRKEQIEAEALLKRPLTPPEADALAFHYSKGFRYTSYGPPVGVAVGLWRAFATKDEFRWPLVPRRMSDRGAWQLNKETHELSFRGRTLLRGPGILPIIHILKASVYVNFGFAVAGLLAGTYGVTVAAVGQLTDSRLLEYKEAISEFRTTKGGDLQGSNPPSKLQSRTDPLGQGDKSAGELWRNHRRTISKSEDDASPTAASDDIFSDKPETTDGNKVSHSEGQLRRDERRYQPSAGRGPTGNQAATFQVEKAEAQTQSFPDDFGMANSDVDDQSPTSNTSGDVGAWERIRRDNVSGVAVSQNLRGLREEREQRERSIEGGSFTFPSSEGERSFAKDEAQKHFDERVDQERRGEDFGSGRGRR